LLSVSEAVYTVGRDFSFYEILLARTFKEFLSLRFFKDSHMAAEGWVGKIQISMSFKLWQQPYTLPSAQAR
jgi:hypothetical protein